MKFVLGRPPESEQFSPLEDGWTPLREPTRMWVLQLACIPVGVALAVAVASLASAMGLSDTVVIDMRVVLALAVIIPLHELLHAVSFPARLSSPRVMFGFWPVVVPRRARMRNQGMRSFWRVDAAPVQAR